MNKSSTIAFVHHKGGTGKTTACINVAGWLAKLGYQVLVVDIDPQGNATMGLGVDRSTIKNSIYEVLFGQCSLNDILLETESGVYLAPSSINLLAAEMHLAGTKNNAFILQHQLKKAESYFDFILIDVPPGSTLLMINGIVASRDIIIPMNATIFSYETLETLKALLMDLANELDVHVNILMILLRDHSKSFFDVSTTLQMKGLVQHFLKENALSNIDIFTIPFSSKMNKAQMTGSPISHYSAWSHVGQRYKQIAKGLLAKWH